MLYRSGYSLKDPRQSHILALRMTHANFQELLSQACVTHGTALTPEERKKPVRVQWDPERGPRLEELPYRSIQIGISGDLSRQWAEEWIEDIEDVTEQALAFKREVEGDVSIGVEELVALELMRKERVYEVSDELREVLKMVFTG